MNTHTNGQGMGEGGKRNQSSAETYRAYDYEAQRWIEGEAARIMRLKQATETLAILEGPRGEEFLRFNGTRDTLAEAVASLKRQITELEQAGAVKVKTPNYTPGPWTQYETEIIAIRPNGHTTKIATVCEPPVPYSASVLDANGAMLAAAPDMFAALRTSEAALAVLGSEKLSDGARQWLGRARKENGEALAKAKGGAR